MNSFAGAYCHHLDCIGPGGRVSVMAITGRTLKVTRKGNLKT